MSRLRWYEVIVQHLAEPRWITALQVCSYLVAAAAGVLVVVAALPYLLVGVLSPWLATAVGLVLTSGGVLGAVSCWRGTWWLERVALLLCGLGWILLVPSVLAIHIWPVLKVFILLLLALVVLDCCKRYRRIDWAYLDPTK